jgi:hypothetical protein
MGGVDGRHYRATSMRLAQGKLAVALGRIEPGGVLTLTAASG